MSTERTALRNYTRWTKTDRGLVADLLGGFDISVLDAGGVSPLVTLDMDDEYLTPDEARLIGVRLIEAAALADGDRAIRRAPGGGQ